jgi:hypothetical protein
MSEDDIKFALKIRSDTISRDAIALIERLQADNQRLKAELDALKPGLPLKGVIKDGKVVCTGVDPPAEKQ